MGASIDTPTLLTAREVAARLKVGLDTVYRLHSRGTLRGIRWTESGPLRFREDDLVRLVNPDATTGDEPGVDRGVVEPASRRDLRRRRDAAQPDDETEDVDA